MTVDTLLTVEQVAAHFHVVPKTVHAWVRKGLLVPTEMGGVRRFAQSDVEAAQRRARRTPERTPEQPTRPALAVVGTGWNDSACRPYGMTMAQWQALGLTKEEWLAQQATVADATGRRSRRRRQAG